MGQNYEFLTKIFLFPKWIPITVFDKISLVFNKIYEI
jgi:hypothetical protein